MPLIILIAAAACLIILGMWLFRKIDVAPYPNMTKWLLYVPLPGLTNRKLIRLLEPKSGENLLEVGPGTGLQTIAVAPYLGKTGRLTIVDIQSVMLAHTMRRVRRCHIENVTSIEASAERLPFEDDSFDGGYLVTALGEIPNPINALRELRRAIKPNGRLIVGEWVYDKHGISQRQLREWAELVGFKEVHCSGNALAYLAKCT